MRWQSYNIVVSLVLCPIIAYTDFLLRSKMNINYNKLENDEFAEFYFLEDKKFVPIQFIDLPEDLNYLPKCCPPEYMYHEFKHNCIEDKTFSDLVEKVNLIKTGLDCEVIVDHVVSRHSLNISNDREALFDDKIISFGDYCVDHVYNESNFIVRECKKKDYCLSHTHDFCIKKCCPDGFQYINRKCIRNPTFGIDMEIYRNISLGYKRKGSFAIYHNTSTCSKYIRDYDHGGITLASNGSVMINATKLKRTYSINEEMYCIDGNMLSSTSESSPIFLLCVQDSIADHFKLSRIVLLVSCFCLLLTVLVFIIIGKVRTLMGKIVTIYSSTMFVAFSVLAFAQFSPNLGTACKPVAYGILFSFTATFSWMNVMCYEIWKTLGVVKSGIPIEEQKKVFLKYNLYGWTIPTIITMLTLLFNTIRVLPDEIHPFLGVTHCILENRTTQNLYGHTLFAVLPQAIMLSINAFFFIKSLRHFNLVKLDGDSQGEAQQAKKKKLKIHKYDVQRFAMITKLFFIMGFSWIFEEISSVINFKQYEVGAVIEQIFDIFNCLQGVLIFCVFVLNRNTLKRLFKRFKKNKKVQEDVKNSSISASELSAEQQEMGQTP
nr:probable G-protein coupled receptor Mth-like 6 [Onthophagus taurus]